MQVTVEDVYRISKTFKQSHFNPGVEDVYRISKTFKQSHFNPGVGTGCVYVDMTGNHCVTGEILYKLGYDMNVFEESDDLNKDTIDCVLDSTGWYPDFTDSAVDFLVDMQAGADGGHCWGDAIDNAIIRHNNSCPAGDEVTL